MAALVWLVGARGLPGGRWAAVHLFAVGVLTVLIVALTHHFAQALLHTPERTTRPARLALAAAGAVLLLVGLPAGATWAVAAGGTALLGAVSWLYVDLRRLRKAAVGARFAFVVRGYERACGQFAHGGLLGLLMGTGVLGGSWYLAARTAHLHVNLLGWVGLVFLASATTLVPTALRTRIPEGAETRAAHALRHATTAVSIVSLGFLLTGAGGPWAVGGRILATAALALYAVAATVLARDAARARRTALDRAAAPEPALSPTGRAALPVAAPTPPPVAGRGLAAAVVWLAAAVWGDALTVAIGAPARWQDAVGVALLAGALIQGVSAALGHLLPLSRGGARAQAWQGPRLLRLLAANLGTALLVFAAAWSAAGGAGTPGAVAARAGWVLVVAAAAAHLLPAPARAAGGTVVPGAGGPSARAAVGDTTWNGRGNVEAAAGSRTAVSRVKSPNAIWIALNVMLVAAVVLAFVTRGTAPSTAQTGPDSAGAAAPAAATVMLTEFAFTPATIPAPVGTPLTITAVNDGTIQHDLTIDGEGATPLIDSGGSEDLELDGLEAGSYRFYCSVPGHADSGMEGTLEVNKVFELTADEIPANLGMVTALVAQEA